jgi:hypothetical protein
MTKERNHQPDGMMKIIQSRKYKEKYNQGKNGFKNLQDNIQEICNTSITGVAELKKKGLQAEKCLMNSWSSSSQIWGKT